MITFNRILEHDGIEPRTVLLLRHQDTRHPGAPRPYDLWRANDGRFETYQSIQKRDRFAVGALLASFVATPADETLFVGLYLVQSVGEIPVGVTDPITRDQDLSGYYWY